jgi:hypothetical protein
VIQTYGDLASGHHALAPHTVISSRRAGGVGSASCCCPRLAGPVASGRGRPRSRPRSGWNARRGLAVPDCTGRRRNAMRASMAGGQEAHLPDRQVLLQTARWLPDRHIVGVADSSFAVIDLVNAVRPGRAWCMVARLRLDARLFDPPPPRRRNAVGRPPTIGRASPRWPSVFRLMARAGAACR